MQLLDSGTLSIFSTDLSQLYTDFTGVKLNAQKSHDLTKRFEKIEEIKISTEEEGLK